jgi:hypothetical protein
VQTRARVAGHSSQERIAVINEQLSYVRSNTISFIDTSSENVENHIAVGLLEE